MNPIEKKKNWNIRAELKERQKQTERALKKDNSRPKSDVYIINNTVYSVEIDDISESKIFTESD
jgi:hypothetical protein